VNPFQDGAPVDAFGDIFLAIAVSARAFDQIADFKIESIYKFFMFWGIV
jgi:hypothetical protein